jgi:Putative peptidoglycan binding domain
VAADQENHFQEAAMKAIPRLQSYYWRHNNRLQEAATTGFRSMLKGRDANTEAVFLLQTCLKLLDGRAAIRTGELFGPFDFGNESNGPSNSTYGAFTEQAVSDFQSASGMGESDIDGIAGIETLHMIDAHLLGKSDEDDKPGPAPSPHPLPPPPPPPIGSGRW